MGRASRSAKARHIHATSTPMPYPMAPVMPQTSPCIRPVRGSNEGESDRHTKTRAPTSPGSEYRSAVRDARSPRRLGDASFGAHPRSWGPRDPLMAPHVVERMARLRMPHPAATPLSAEGEIMRITSSR